MYCTISGHSMKSLAKEILRANLLLLPKMWVGVDYIRKNLGKTGFQRSHFTAMEAGKKNHLKQMEVWIWVTRVLFAFRSSKQCT